MLREAGASEVHVRISSPPVAWPCFFGIDFATRAELIAPGLTGPRCRRLDQRGFARVHLARGAHRLDGHRAAQVVHGMFQREYPVDVPRDRMAEMGLEEVNG